MSWFIDAYPRLAEWRATVNRLTLFAAACEDDRAPPRALLVEPGASGRDELRLESLVLDAADGQEIARVPAARFEAGDRVLITGPSGAGKSSLLRAVAGIARGGSGRIVLPAHQTLMFVPQRPYLPEGSLREALAYPLEVGAFGAQAIARAVLRAGLGKYVDRLDQRARWASVLSPGEQQRVHFARVLLHQPDWVFLDESSSALDEAGERDLYRAVQEHCPAATVVSVGHRASLRPLHDVKWSLRDGAARKPARRRASSAATA